jgi:hypothetical protein
VAFNTRTAIQTDNFNAAALSANWSQVRAAGGTMAIIGSTHVEAVTGNAGIRWTGGGAFTNDQYSSVKTGNFTGAGGTALAGVWVRVSADTDAARDYYYAQIADDNGVGTQIRTFTSGMILNGANTNKLTQSVTWAEGDIISIEAIGTTVFAYQNTTLIGQWTDSNLTTDLPGIGISLAANLQEDDWEGGSVVLADTLMGQAIF